jgi:hypothetical protein
MLYIPSSFLFPFSPSYSISLSPILSPFRFHSGFLPFPFLPLSHFTTSIPLMFSWLSFLIAHSAPSFLIFHPIPSFSLVPTSESRHHFSFSLLPSNTSFHSCIVISSLFLSVYVFPYLLLCSYFLYFFSPLSPFSASSSLYISPCIFFRL